MNTQHHEIEIHAPREAVWHTMLHSPGYEQWTAAFCEGSRYEGSWDPGATIRFLAPNGDGMVARIDEHRPAEFVSIRHLGLIHQGVDETESEAVKAWAPCHENYSYIDTPGGTRVRVDVDVFGAYESWMTDTWPKALQALKTLCEGPAAERAA